MVDDRYLYVIQDAGYTSPCWLWQGGVSKGGYGVIAGRRAIGASTIAHKYFYIKSGRTINSSRELDHLCNNKLCVNPEHMEQVTHMENVRRRWRFLNGK